MMLTSAMPASAFTSLLPGAAALTPVEITQRLYLAQAAAGLGLMVAAALVLSAIYLFYLWLRRCFSHALCER
jgi:hypothetical protein